MAARFESFDASRRAAEADAAEAMRELTEIEQRARQLPKPPAGKKPATKPL